MKFFCGNFSRILKCERYKDDGRLHNIVYYNFVILFMINVFYLQVGLCVNLLW